MFWSYLPPYPSPCRSIPFPIHLPLCSFLNQSRPICAAHIFLAVCSSTGEWVFLTRDYILGEKQTLFLIFNSS